MRARRREAGYNLVILMVAITLLNVAVAIALPLWSQAIERDKEEELIFRGLQYAEAIRVFRNRFGRAPVRLEELLEAKPRSIRQLWKDPTSKDGRWQLLFEGVQQPPGNLQVQEPGKDDDEQGRDGGGGALDPRSGLTTAQKDELAIGPIEGVRSRSTKASILVFFGGQRLNQWEFRWQLIAQGLPAPGQSFGVPGAGGGTAAPIQSARWIGRPWPSFLGLSNAPPQFPAGAGQKPGPNGNPPGSPPGGPAGGVPGDQPSFGVPGGLAPDPGKPEG